jgi:hypothetical protein
MAKIRNKIAHLSSFDIEMLFKAIIKYLMSLPYEQ